MKMRSPRRRSRRRLLAWGGAGALGVLGLIAVGGALSIGKSAPREGPPPATAAPTPTPVPSGQRLIFTYYFYWYDAATGAHLQEADGLRYHFPAQPLVSWANPAWHAKQLSDMRWAGINVALPVYWGHDRPQDAWSWQGLDVLAKTWRGLQREGSDPPRIGMFLDTTIVAGRNLTSADGKRWFYSNFHDFFTRIPREAWALVDGRPVAFLFTSDWTAAMDQTTFDAVSDQFQRDFGARPYIVREVSWDYPILRWENGVRVRDYTRAILTDNSYLWDAAAHGFVDRGGVAEVGPGYDDHLVPGRGAGTVMSRENGAFYRRAFAAAISSGKPLLAIETWDELHEGSGIAETVEYGRQYLEITRDMARQFHAAPGP
ncbi:MAG: DUF5010 domain-containing protein [Chloroflexota bacterium]